MKRFKQKHFCTVTVTKCGRSQNTTLSLQIQALLILLFNQVSSSAVIECPVPVPVPVGLPSEVVYGWRNIDFNFKSPAHRQKMIDEKKYIVSHVGIAGIKISGDRMFISIGRYIPGVPVTLAVLPYHFFNISDFLEETGNGNGNGPLLTPFPNWEMQEVGNCEAFQTVQSMEIDQFNRMWILDVGKSDLLGETRSDCPAKLVIYDLNNNTDQVIRKYVFPNDIIPYLDGVHGCPVEIVVGCLSEVDCKAYIADVFQNTLIIYSFTDNTSWKVTHRSMEREEGSENIRVFGKPFKLQLGIDGLALSPRKRNFDTLYYAPLAGYNTYSVLTSTLDLAREQQQQQQKQLQQQQQQPQQLLQQNKIEQRKNNIFELPDASITMVDRRTSVMDGFAMDSKGRLFWGASENNSVYYFQTPPPLSGNVHADIRGGKRHSVEQRVVAKNDRDFIWIDTFGFDQRGYLFFVANGFHLAPLDYDRSKINFKIVRIFVGAQSYVYDT